MARYLKGFLIGIFFLGLVLTMVLFILLRYPTDAPTPSFSFAPKADLDHLPELKVAWIPNGSAQAWEPFVISGGRFSKKVKMVFGALLVEHPKGTFLIDGGVGPNVLEELTGILKILDSLMGGKIENTIDIQKKHYPKLNEVGFILLTHGHWDHLDGAEEFPGIPVYALSEEIEFLTDPNEPFGLNVFPKHVAALKDRFKPIHLKNQPYENFAKSLDFFEDGSVVLVALPGHTPGSLGIFLNVAPTQRYFVVGDALWTVNALGEPEARSFLAELFSDHDRDQARYTRAQLRELKNFSSEITLVPVHDQEAVGVFVKE